MSETSEPTEGLTADGRFVTSGNTSDDLSDQIICGTDRNGDILRCAELQPIEFTEQNWHESFDFDAALFANYGKDWWLGLLYRPARMGLMGSTPKSNMTEAGDYIYECLALLKRNLRGSYLLMRAMFRISMGLDEHEAEIESCLSANPEQLKKFQDLNATIDDQLSRFQSTAARRVAGGAFVGFSLRKVRLPRKYLQGDPAPLRGAAIGTEFAAKMTINFVLAGFGAMLRTYMDHAGITETRTAYATSWQRVAPPTPLDLLGAALLGDSRALSLDPDEITTLYDIIQKCDTLPADLEEELQAFSTLINVFSTFYEDRR